MSRDLTQLNKEDLKKLIQSNKKNSVLLADYIIEGNNKIIRSNVNNKLYIYNNKYYELLDDKKIEGLIHKFLRENNITDIWKNNRISEIKKSMHVRDDESIEVVTPDDYDNLICLSNGILNIDTFKFVSHSSDYYFTTIVDIQYDSSQVNASFFQKTLEGIFTLDDGTPDNEMIDLIYQIGGDLIYPKVKVNQEGLMYLFLGSGANGKSVLIDTFRMFFPKESTTYLDLAKLCGSGHEKSRLLRSRLNVCSEEKGNTVDSEELKKIISSDGITINPKFEEPFEFIPRTKIILASNKKPYFSDTSYGIYRRLYTIEFKNRFVSSLEYEQVPERQKNRTFVKGNRSETMQNITKEKSAILNLFINGLKKLKNNSWELPESQNVKETMDNYKVSNDTVGYFLNEYYEYSDNASTPVENILSDYRDWYKTNVNERPLNYSVISLGSKIKEMYSIDSHRGWEKDGRGRYTGYALIRKSQTNDETDIIDGDIDVESIEDIFKN